VSKQYPNLTNQILLEENLRIKCIHESVKRDFIDLEPFFNYMYSMFRYCLHETGQLTKECVEYHMSDIEINVDWVN